MEKYLTSSSHLNYIALLEGLECMNQYLNTKKTTKADDTEKKIEEEKIEKTTLTDIAHEKGTLK